MADTPAGRFYVRVDSDRWTEAKRLADLATGVGNRAAFVRWFKEATYRLSHEADEWGESRAPLPGGRIENRVGMAGDLTVWYSVDPARMVVYVKLFRLRGFPDAGDQGGA